MKKTFIEVDVQTATQCSFIPFTAVPDQWRGRKVRIEVIGVVESESEDVPWSLEGSCR